MTLWSRSVLFWSNSAQCRPSSAKFGRNGAKFDRPPTIGQHPATSSENLLGGALRRLCLKRSGTDIGNMGKNYLFMGHAARARVERERVRAARRLRPRGEWPRRLVSAPEARASGLRATLDVCARSARGWPPRHAWRMRFAAATGEVKKNKKLKITENKKCEIC